MAEGFREQRAQRTIDQTRGQRLFLGESAFALEEAAGNLAAGVELLLVVDRQREEVDSVAQAVTSTTVSAILTRTAPPAWRAISPVSSVTWWFPY
jgi:hypothetical protein